MNTITELTDYCLEPEVVGALLLTGEWGCGKTYLIDNTLKEALRDKEGKLKAIILRVSLFGISSIEEINKTVKCLWLQEYFSQIGGKCGKVGKATKLVRKGADVVGKLDFLPDWIKGIATTDWQSFTTIANTIEKKAVVLVFDDLERCRMDTVDVLGCINDYCENQKFHTIIVANQEKISIVERSQDIKMGLSKITSEKNKEEKIYAVDLKLPKASEPGKISYEEIKEKIIQRTVQYIPNYEEIVEAVINNIQYSDEEYKAFIIAHFTGLLELFAPDREKKDIQYMEDEDIFKPIVQQATTEKYMNHPHNIRSLKCAICDFYRVYKILRKNEITNLDCWLYSFTSYVIAYKAGIAKEGDYGTFFSDEEVKKMFPAFNTKYLFHSVKQWILYGTWNEELVQYETKRFLIQQRAASPAELVRTRRIIELDEDVIEQGFSEVLNMAYGGNLSLDEYVQFILNCYWIRVYAYKLPADVEWEKVQNGIKKVEKDLLRKMPEGQILHSFLSNENKEFYLEDEWNTYLLIKKFENENQILFSRNRYCYIEGIKENAISAFTECQNKQYDVFNDEMAIATAIAFESCNNSDKYQFSNYFKEMWEPMLSSIEFDCDKSEKAFEILKDKLEDQRKLLLENGRKQFALLHTKAFIDQVSSLIEKIQQKRNIQENEKMQEYV